MFDKSNGAFGAPPGYQDYSNISGMNYAGAQDSPSMKNAFGANLQYAFRQPSYYSPTLSYQAPKYTAKDYGFMDYAKHNILGISRGYGTNELSRKAASAEYRTLAIDNAMYSAGGGVAGGLAGAYIGSKAGLIGGLAGGLIGGTVGASLGGYRDENYADSQFSNYLSGNIVSKGRMGLSGAENTRLTKERQRMSSSDPFLEASEVDEIMKTFKTAGGMNHVSSSSQLSSVMKGLLKDVKSLADTFGSSDYVSLTKEIARFSKIGFGKNSSHMAARTKNAASVSGISYEEMKDNISGYIARAPSNRDSRISSLNALQDSMNASAFMQDKDMPTTTRDRNKMMRIQSNIRTGYEKYSESMSGVSRDQKLAYLTLKQERDGGGFQGLYDNFFDKSIQEQNKEMYESDIMKNKQGLIFNKDSAQAILSRNRELGTLDVGNKDRKNMIKSIVDQTRSRTGGPVSRDDLLSTFQYHNNFGLSGEESAVAIEGAMNYVEDGDFRQLDEISLIEKNTRRRQDRANRLKRIRESGKKVSSVKKFFSETEQSIREFAGYSGSEKVQDMYSNTINGMSAMSDEEFRSKKKMFNFGLKSSISDSFNKITSLGAGNDLENSFDKRGISRNSIIEGHTYSRYKERYNRVTGSSEGMVSEDNYEKGMDIRKESVDNRFSSMSKMGKNLSIFGETSSGSIRDAVNKNIGLGADFANELFNIYDSENTKKDKIFFDKAVDTAIGKGYGVNEKEGRTRLLSARLDKIGFSGKNKNAIIGGLKEGSSIESMVELYNASNQESGEIDANKMRNVVKELSKYNDSLTDSQIKSSSKKGISDGAKSHIALMKHQENPSLNPEQIAMHVSKLNEEQKTELLNGRSGDVAQAILTSDSALESGAGRLYTGLKKKKTTRKATALMNTYLRYVSSNSDLNQDQLSELSERYANGASAKELNDAEYEMSRMSNKDAKRGDISDIIEMTRMRDDEGVKLSNLKNSLSNIRNSAGDIVSIKAKKDAKSMKRFTVEQLESLMTAPNREDAIKKLKEYSSEMSKKEGESFRKKGLEYRDAATREIQTKLGAQKDVGQNSTEKLIELGAESNVLLATIADVFK